MNENRTDLIEYDFNGVSIRVVMINDEPWFVAKDVCDVLEYTNARKAIADHVDKEDVTNRYVPMFSNNYNLINESGLFSLILSSKKPEAKTFKRWVTHEVLPQIRKTGSYINDKQLQNIQSGMLANIELIINQKLDKIISSKLSSDDVRKADETVHSMGYDKISHSEKIIIMRSIKHKAKVGPEHCPERYNDLKSSLFLAYGVRRFVDIRKADVKRILGDISKYDFKNQQLSFHSHLKIVQ